MNPQSIDIRTLRAGDAEPLRAIYNYYVANTAITFDIEPRSTAQWADWMNKFSDTGRNRCFVAVDGGEIVGWASSDALRARAAYDTSVETTVYLAPGCEGGGMGRALYACLFEVLEREDIHRAFAAITAPNPASVRLHEKFGFCPVGRYPEVGRKFGVYHDVDLLWRPVPLDTAKSL